MARKTQKQLAKEIGLRLKDARENGPAGRFSQREAGILAGFGSKTEDPQSRVSNYERGKNNISLADLIALADIYKISPVFLAFGVREFPAEEDEFLEKYRAAGLHAKRFVMSILNEDLKDKKASKRKKALISN